jgi:hypothetical protein
MRANQMIHTSPLAALAKPNSVGALSHGSQRFMKFKKREVQASQNQRLSSKNCFRLASGLWTKCSIWAIAREIDCKTAFFDVIVSLYTSLEKICGIGASLFSFVRSPISRWLPFILRSQR